MIVRLIKNPKFLMGFLFILLLIVASFSFSILGDGSIPQTSVIYDDNGNAIRSAPHSPLNVPPFGTDMVGKEIFHSLIKGAKYTIGIAILVAAFRLFLSVFLSFILESYLPVLNRYINRVTEAFHYVPISLLTFFILSPVLIEGALGGFEYSFWDRVYFEVIILTLVAIPTLVTLLSNEMKIIFQNDFIDASKIMGANRWELYLKHVLPFLKPKFWIHFTQQIIQVLILLVHLGLLNILFGGARTSEFTQGVHVYISITSEWSGMIGSTYKYLWVAPWIPLAPLLMFSITILSLNLILEGFKQSLEHPLVIQNKNSKAKTKRTPAKEDFAPIKVRA
ncbi:ABC transporter permease subunit [Pseudalkalibacillus berkeleyi]|uniref:ABC transporter permease subunit n=1 Tax=Pseudalkalibacillus berkeleyi TaxID=1069813 RepID=A0ABS9GYT9_9BACL|nr:ABC transporter permease subunit [Pseudalkalibacillus berkeleyi]MCF6136658.1 ABC transporter permease subunit [Pseudalkalibacillus berkeleyi]